MGWIAGRTGVLGDDAPGVLARLSYYVATPALLVYTLAGADPGVLASATLIAIAGSAVLCGLVYVVVARWRWHQRPARLTTGVFASSYVNAGNLGIPISAYVLGDAAYAAPVLLFQVLVFSPVGLSVLAGAHSGRSRAQLLTQPLRTPIVLGCAAGLALAATGWRLPEVLWEPVELVAELAVPAALLAYGVSLHGAPRPATGARTGPVWLAVVLKTLAQPVFAYGLGRWVAGLHGTALLAVTVTSALPTAQNVFVYAATYDEGTEMARDVILLTTIASIPVLLAITLLLGGR